MTTLLHWLPNATSNRRLLLLLLIATLFLAGAVGVRVTREQISLLRRPTPVTIVEPGSAADIAQLQARLGRNPEDSNAYAQLGQSLLLHLRETGDVSLYERAGQAFAQALQRDAQHVDALVGQGILALALHDFEGALEWAEQAWAVNPFRAQTLGVKVDALVELGRYPEAVGVLQQMVDLRPDLQSYTRVSYLRELHGETEGAIEAMTQAASMGIPGSEQWLWALTQLGHLYWNNGRLVEAEAVYRQALHLRADYPYALAGLARVQAAQGDLPVAIAQMEGLVKRLPLPEFVVALGDYYAAAGHVDQAQQQYDLVRVMQKLNAAAGMNVDLELAAFGVEYGDDPVAALTQAQVAYAARPTIYAADTLAWAYYHVGDYVAAQASSYEALRLGTRDALFHFHAALIARALGDERGAYEHAQQVRAINRHFSLRHKHEMEQFGTEPSSPLHTGAVR